MQPQEKKQHYSFSQYEALENEIGQRLIYFFGEVFAMAGTTKRHNKIVGNIAFALRELIKETECEVFTENVKLELIAKEYYVYPDILLTCHPEDTTDDTQTLIKFPSLIVEVLSESTQSYDLQEKKTYYFKIPQLQYYLLVYPKTYKVELYERKSNFWIFSFYEQAEDIIQMPQINLALSLETIYQNIQL